jgi:hypothetical protein
VPPRLYACTDGPGLRGGQVRANRAETLDAAYIANAGRFRHRRPSPPKLPTVAWINQPTIENDAQRKR